MLDWLLPCSCLMEQSILHLACLTDPFVSTWRYCKPPTHTHTRTASYKTSSYLCDQIRLTCVQSCEQWFVIDCQNKVQLPPMWECCLSHVGYQCAQDVSIKHILDLLLLKLLARLCSLRTSVGPRFKQTSLINHSILE